MLKFCNRQGGLFIPFCASAFFACVPSTGALPRKRINDSTSTEMPVVSDPHSSCGHNQRVIRSGIRKDAKRESLGGCAMRALFIFGFGCFCTVATAADRLARTIQLAPNPVGQSATIQAPQPSPKTPTTKKTSTPCADSQTPATQNPSTTQGDCGDSTPAAQLNANQLGPILSCIGTDVEATKNDLVCVNPKQAKDVFGCRYWVPQRQAAMTTDNWGDASKAILDAVTDKQGSTTSAFVPEIALRADIPIGATACLPGRYVMLLSFNGKQMRVYLNGHLVGVCPIDDSKSSKETLNTILTRDGVAVPATGVSSN